MTQAQTAYEKAIVLIDAANSEDPNHVTEDGKAWPKELLYSSRMSDMLMRFTPAADDAIKLAVRAQHVQRWKSPRSDYPMDRTGYLKWRKELYKFHAQTAADLLLKAGCNEDTINRVGTAVAKKSLKANADTQLLEDVTALVFLEHYLLEFSAKHPDYDEDKWLDIIRKTWRKMSEPGQQFALSGSIRLPEPLLPLIQKAVATS